MYPQLGEISCFLYMCVWLDRVIVVTVGYGSVEHSGNVPHASEHTLIDGRGTRTLRTGRVLEPAHSWLAAPLLWVPYIPLVPPRLLMYRFAIPFCFCSKGEGMRYVSHRHLRILLPYRLRRSYVQQRGGSVRPGLLDFHCVPPEIIRVRRYSLSELAKKRSDTHTLTRVNWGKPKQCPPPFSCVSVYQSFPRTPVVAVRPPSLDHG